MPFSVFLSLLLSSYVKIVPARLAEGVKAGKEKVNTRVKPQSGTTQEHLLKAAEVKSRKKYTEKVQMVNAGIACKKPLDTWKKKEP